jgi:hypothetical protein
MAEDSAGTFPRPGGFVSMRRLIVLVAVAVVPVLIAAAALAGRSSSASATLLIRHQQAHCHAWSLNGGPFQAAQTVQLRRGAALTVINNDLMPHRLLELAGPRVAMRNSTTMPMGAAMHGPTEPGLMNHMGAATTVRFDRPGIYRFRTRAGEDYMSGFVTTGADNVLSLRVIVH